MAEKFDIQLKHLKIDLDDMQRKQFRDYYE